MSEINVNELASMFAPDSPDNPFSELITQIMSTSDATWNDSVIEIYKGMVGGALTNSLKKEAIDNIIHGFEDNNLTREQAKQAIENIEKELYSTLDTLQPSAPKREILEYTFQLFTQLLDDALEHYHNYNIALPMTLEDGAHMPTYAHEGDAAADLYAAEDMTLPAHSISNMVKTGVHIQLPEGWIAMIFPRSSMGAKTGLRLSNSVGIIDTGYLGQLGVLYDNISDSDYTIHAGDRIAQLMVMPSYRFKPQVVKELQDTTRGEGGFGSTGK